MYKIFVNHEYFEYCDSHPSGVIRCRSDLWDYLLDYTDLDPNALKLHIKFKVSILTVSICSPDRIFSDKWVSLNHIGEHPIWFEIESERDALLLKLFV